MPTAIRSPAWMKGGAPPATISSSLSLNSYMDLSFSCLDVTRSAIELLVSQIAAVFNVPNFLKKISNTAMRWLVWGRLLETCQVGDIEIYRRDFASRRKR